MAPFTLQQPLIMNQIMSIGLHLKPELKFTNKYSFSGMCRGPRLSIRSDMSQ